MLRQYFAAVQNLPYAVKHRSVT